VNYFEVVFLESALCTGWYRHLIWWRTMCLEW